MNSNYKARGYAFSILSAIFLAACGGGGGDVPTPTFPSTTVTPPPTTAVTVSTPKTVEESLNKLGVNMESTARQDSQGNEFPEDYAPMGNIMMVRQIYPVQSTATVAAVGRATTLASTSTEPTYVMGRAEELFLGGFKLRGRNSGFSVIENINLVGLTPDASAVTVPTVLEDIDVEQNTSPWKLEVSNPLPGGVPMGTRRDAVAIDVTGDGLLQPVLVYAADDNGIDELRLAVFDGNDSTPLTDIHLITGGNFLPAHDVRVAGGDFDGDGRDELAIAIARRVSNGAFESAVGLYIVDDAISGFSIIGEHHIVFRPTFEFSSITLDIDSFKADHDRTEEIALVVNESEQLSGRLGIVAVGSYASRFFVFDVTSLAGIVQLASGAITAEVLRSDGTPRSATAVMAYITTDDIDNDQLDELIFGGFEEIIDNCKSIFGPNVVKYVLFAYGGRYNDFSPVHASANEVNTPCFGTVVPTPFTMRYAALNVLDFDGDGDMDIQINDFVFDRFPRGEWLNSANLVTMINDRAFIYGPENKRAYYDRQENVVSVSDQTGDGIEDIISVNLSRDSRFSSAVRVYAWNLEFSAVKLATKIDIDISSSPFGEYANPIIIATDVEYGKVLQLRYTGKHSLSFTEPIVIAAIAAAPCKREIGQDACFSKWGSSQFQALERGFSTEVFGSVGIGAGATIGVGAAASWRVLATMSLSAKRIRSKSYELRKSQSYITGPFEDGVVFSSIPMDRYEYVVVSNTTQDARQLGDTVQVQLPRTPDTRIVERTFYNSRVRDGAEKIDERVFGHLPGNVFSYPDAGEKDAIMDSNRTLVELSRLDAFRSRFSRKGDDAFAMQPAELGLDVGPRVVGEGGGSTELGLEYTETSESGGALALSYSVKAEMTAGGAWEVEVGYENSYMFAVSHGNSSSFVGSVDSIESGLYLDNRYGFGLFAYVQNLGDQEIEVVNFWVER